MGVWSMWTYVVLSDKYIRNTFNACTYNIVFDTSYNNMVWVQNLRYMHEKQQLSPFRVFNIINRHIENWTRFNNSFKNMNGYFSFGYLFKNVFIFCLDETLKHVKHNWTCVNKCKYSENCWLCEIKVEGLKEGGCPIWVAYCRHGVLL